MARLARTTRRLGQLLRLLLRVTVTLLVLGGAGAAVFYGQSFLEARAAAVPAPEAAPLTPVSVRSLQVEDGYRQTRSFVGQIEPRKTVAVSFELAGKLIDVAVDEGEEVRAGQLVAAQDVDLLEADQAQLTSSRQALEAQRDFALQRLERAERLLESGFASQERLDQAISARDELDARIRETDARLRTIAIRLEKSTIEAPFDGRVTRRFLDGGEALSPGQPVLEIVETEAPLVRVGVPLSIAPETLRDAVLVLGGREFAAEFVTLRPDIDATTRTRTALYRPMGPVPAAFGQTAEIQVETEVRARGTWVPVNSLKEGARGQWTLLVVDDGDVVQRATALVVYAESDRVFVQGSFPPGTRMIEEGPQRVVPGQRVTVVPSARLGAVEG
ncbi:MAG: efflux RND transporter periplasmic adaptor subunit [Pseudomonadota bacterium]